MSWQRSIQAAVKALKKEEQSLVRQLDHLRGKIGELTGMSKGRRGAGAAAKGGGRGRRLSEEGRRAISLAAKRRWAKYRAKQGK